MLSAQHVYCALGHSYMSIMCIISLETLWEWPENILLLPKFTRSLGESNKYTSPRLLATKDVREEGCTKFCVLYNLAKTEFRKFKVNCEKPLLPSRIVALLRHILNIMFYPSCRA